MSDKTIVSIGWVAEVDDGHTLHIKGYDAEQKREFNELFLYDGFNVRGKYIDPRQDPLSAECRKQIKEKVAEKLKSH